MSCVTHVHTYGQTGTHTHTHTHIHTHTHTRIDEHTHKNIYKHTQSGITLPQSRHVDVSLVYIIIKFIKQMILLSSDSRYELLIT